jgi:transposase
VREKLKDRYSETGRPSIDPELLLRILLIGYLYGITSERKLVELRMHLACGGSPVWVSIRRFHTTLHSPRNRHGRFQESKLFEQLFEQIVKQCVEVGLVRGKAFPSFRNQPCGAANAQTSSSKCRCSSVNHW